MKQRWQHWAILTVITLLCAIGILSWSSPGLTQSSQINLQTAGLKLEKVEEGVYALIASTDFPPKDPNLAICNAGIVIGSDGVLVIDPFQNKELGNLVLKTVEGLTEKPVRYVLNTHYHFDHTGGNSAIAAKGIPLLGRGRIRDLMMNLNKSLDPTIIPPALIINSESTIWLGKRRVEIKRSEGHARGTDLIAYIPDVQVLFAGDILFNERIPYTADGNINQWINSLSELNKIYPTAKIVPGHGPVTNDKGLQNLQEYFEELRQLALSWKGLKKEQALKSAATIPSKYEKYKFQALYPSNLETAYQQITKSEK